MYRHIDRHLDHLRAAGFSPNTIDKRYELLARLYHDLGELHALDTHQLAGWLAGPGWSPNTRITYHKHTCGYFRWAYATGLIPADPAALLTRPRLPRHAPRRLPRQAMATVLATRAEPWRTIVLLAVYAGLRCCEIATITRADITPEWIRVHGKGGHVDEIPTHEAIWGHVRDRSGLLVTRPSGAPYQPAALSAAFSVWTHRRLKLRGITLHDLRRYYGDSLRRAGVDLEVVRTLMRHASLQTTQRYLSVDEGERAAAIRSLPSAA